MQPAHAQVDDRDLTDAIDRARADVWSAQRADGTWECRGDTGPLITTHVAIILRHIGALDDALARGVARYLAAQQRADGSLSIYPGAPEGHVGTTACAWAALSLAGTESAAERRAHAYVERHGGLDRVVADVAEGDLSALFVAMAGKLDPRRLPRWPVTLAALPPVKRWLERRVNLYFLNLPFEAHLITRDLVLRAEGRREPLSAGARRVLAACLETYDAFQNPDGSVNEMALQTATMLAALHSAGLGPEHDRVKRAVAWLTTQATPDGDGLQFSTFSSVTWATAYLAHALVVSGVPVGDPRIERALAWLVDAQCQVDQVPQLNPANTGPKRGGWAFQRVNVRLPDMDDTAVVLALLGEAARRRDELSPALCERLVRGHALGVRWLAGMQNPDGGWAAYTRGHRSKRPGPGITRMLRFPPRLGELVDAWRDLPLALGDPSTEGVSGRALRALGLAGYTARTPEVQRAMGFLRGQQCDFGGWWGRWLVNYLPTTAHVLLGLRAVDADLRAPWIRRAVEWTLSKQRADGGWGEEAASYVDPSRAGEASRSMPALTGLVVSGLVAAGEAAHPAVARAARYLVETQRADGTWPDHDWLAPSLPPHMFYRYPITTRFYPLAALARVRAARQR